MLCIPVSSTMMTQAIVNISILVIPAQAGIHALRNL